MQLHDKQKEIVSSKARFKIVRAGRRSGKTIVKSETMLFKAITKAVNASIVGKNRSVIFIAPTQKQARSIIWEALKARLNKIGETNEARLEMTVPTADGGKSTIFVGGWENRENYRGMPNVYHIEFDEVDTMKDFFIGLKEIFFPMLIDTGGSAGFGGTPKKENPNLRRLEKEAENNPEWECFHFTTYDNPYVQKDEIEKMRLELDPQTFKQEILAEHVDNEGALFKYNALVDIFSNTIEKNNKKFLTIDVADDGSDSTVLNYWNGLESFKIEKYKKLNTEMIINQIKESASLERIPYSHIIVDAIGVGSAIASSSELEGIIGFKSSYSAIRTDESPVDLNHLKFNNPPHLITDYKNLRSQCIFKLASLVNNHNIACAIKDDRLKSEIIEELSQYQDVSVGDGKRMATQKDDVKAVIGRSPDCSDTFIMRMYFEIKDMVSEFPTDSDTNNLIMEMDSAFNRNQLNSTR